MSKAAPPPPPATVTKTRSSENLAIRNAIVLIAVVATGAALSWLQSILTPLALAIFLMVMIDSFARLLRRRIPALPGWAAISLAMLTSLALIGGATWIIIVNATRFAGQLETYFPRIDAIMAQVWGLIGATDPPTVSTLLDEFDPRRYFSAAAQGLQDVGTVTAFLSMTFLYLAFLIASRAGFERKIVRLFPQRDERVGALQIFGKVRQGIERYLWVQTVTGLMIAGASWAIMAIVGMDNAFFWAFAIFAAGYIPVIGPLVGGLIPPLFALVQFESYLQPAVLLVSLNAVNIVVGNIIQPRMQGDSLNLDPVVVLLALAFWGAVWGLAGMFLSTPLTVLTMVLLAQFKGSLWIAILMSADGDPLGAENAEENQLADKS